MSIYTTENFIQKAKDIHKDTYDYSETVYIHSKRKVKIICKIHEIFEQIPNAHLMGHGCIKCQYIKLRNLHAFELNDVIQKAKSQHNFKFDYSKTIYVNSNTKITIICPIHGIFRQRPYEHINNGQGCPKCGNTSTANKLTLTTQQFINKAKKRNGNKFLYYKTSYIGSYIPVIVICPKHGDFEIIPHDHLKGHGCQKCNASKGEQEIRNVLTKIKYNFDEQYRIKKCKNKYPLPFDFVIWKNNQCLGLIEFQGRQHYEPIAWGSNSVSAEESLFKVQKHDNIKVTYCKQNNIPLLIIPYWEKPNIESLLVKFINTLEESNL